MAVDHALLHHLWLSYVGSIPTGPTKLTIYATVTFGMLGIIGTKALYRIERTNRLGSVLEQRQERHRSDNVVRR